VMGKPLSTFADACSRDVELQLRERAWTLKCAVVQIGPLLLKRKGVERRRTVKDDKDVSATRRFTIPNSKHPERNCLLERAERLEMK
jgi:hypothetical protein